MPGKEEAASEVHRGLPASVRRFFWDCDFGALTWQDSWAFVTERLLAWGDWESVKWLRRKLGDERLRAWLRRRRGRGLDARRLRYWELVLRLPRQEVDAWLADAGRDVWETKGRP
jgi:hypothetical protein